MARTGRPLEYTPELGDMICDAIAVAKGSINRLCKEMKDAGIDFPDKDTIYVWRDKNADFSAKFWIAKQRQMDSFSEHLLDDTDEMQVIAAQGDDPVRDKLRIDALEKAATYKKWMMARLGPKRYADKQNLNIESRNVNESEKDEAAIIQAKLAAQHQKDA